MKNIFGNLVLFCIIICSINGISTTYTDEEYPFLWEGEVYGEMGIEGIDFSLNLKLPPLNIKIISGDSKNIEVSSGNGMPFHKVHFKDKIARFPFAVTDLKTLSSISFRSLEDSVKIAIIPEKPILINIIDNGSDFLFEIYNFGYGSVFNATIEDLEGKIVSFRSLMDGELFNTKNACIGYFKRGEKKEFIVLKDENIVFPIKIIVENGKGEIEENNVYSMRGMSNLCATPGKDGNGGILSGIVNTYYPLTVSVSAGSTEISVGSAYGSSTPITHGDLLLIIQMQDGEINYNNDDSYGDGVSGGYGSGYTNLGNSGKYEFVKALSEVNGGVVSILGAGTGGGLLNDYYVSPSTSTRGRRSAQVVRVPQYTTATLSSTLTALAWNGLVGGILAIDVSGTLTLNGTTSVDGLGFRGGIGRALAGGSAQATDYRILSSINNFGMKGEGIAGTPSLMPNSNAGAGLQGYPNGDSGRGAPGNAGGGANDSNPLANDQNAGGGGGGNGGAGGIGGNTWYGNLPYGGHPGSSLPYSADRLFMGGGGGAGDRNNTGVSDGAPGGGIVLIRANAITGTGTISSNGASIDTMNRDGGGGGGAGGTILIYSNTPGNLSGLTVSANGGKGGDAWPTQPPNGYPGERHGPGGGGGGGIILLSGAPASSSTSGGLNGITTTANDPYAAEPGNAGVVLTNIVSAQIPGIDSGAECSSSTNYIVKTSSAGSGYVYPGQTLTYTITVTNLTGSTWTNVTVTDPLPQGTIWVGTQVTYPTDFSGSFYDQFTAISYSGSNGTIDWGSTPWTEINDDNVVNTGDVQVRQDGSTNAVRLDDSERGLQRPANLSNYQSATVSFYYRRTASAENDASVYCQISNDGGSTWPVTLATVTGNSSNDPNYILSGPYSIPSDYLVSNFRIRFITSSTCDEGDNIFIDNVLINVSGRIYQKSTGGPPPNLASGYTLNPFESLVIVLTVQIDPNLNPSITEITNTAYLNADGGIYQSSAVSNPVAWDNDQDGIPNNVDLDDDNDGILDTVEGTGDTDGDGTPDYLDLDSDGDGVWDLIEGNDANHNGQNDNTIVQDLNNDGRIDTITDTNNNGVDDSYDSNPAAVQNTDGDLYPDFQDPDDDGDGIPTILEGNGDRDGDGTPNYLDPDSDNDGIPDAVEGYGDRDGDGLANFLDLDSDGDGIPDVVEGTGDRDGDGIPNYLDPDSDGDGIPDQTETANDFDNDGIPNYLDFDSDNDGILDRIEGTGDADSDGAPNYLDPDLPLDTDGDGIPDVTEGTGDSDGDGIPNNLDWDSDNDGILDSFEGSTDLDGDGIPNYLDLDSDGDGAWDINEGNDSNFNGVNDNTNVSDSNNDGRIDTITDANGNGLDDSYEENPAVLQDRDGDGIPDIWDGDDDGDGIMTEVEDANGDGNPANDDADGDGIPNYLDFNSDGDSRPDSMEGTNDSDSDGIPDYLDPDTSQDTDGDGIPDVIESSFLLDDFDGDGIPNYLDLDSDGDGIPDSVEGAGDADGDGQPNFLDLDSDGDGILDSIEGTQDTDGDGIPNYKDLDSDGDGISDGKEGTSDFDGDGIPNYLDLDSDGDGITDEVEGIYDGDKDGNPDFLDPNSFPPPHLLRNDETNSLSSYDPSKIFIQAYPLDPALDPLGPNKIPQEGEGARRSLNGSDDDDDFYKSYLPPTWIDPDTTVLTDNSRPLVFYELTTSACTIYLTKDSGKIKVSYTCP